MSEKNSAAVELGRLGGIKGGPARAAALAPEERTAIARKAAIARWGICERELQLCPFCLSDKVRLETSPKVGMVVCDSCHATGPVTKSAQTAVRAWNEAPVRRIHNSSNNQGNRSEPA